MASKGKINLRRLKLTDMEDLLTSAPVMPHAQDLYRKRCEYRAAQRASLSEDSCDVAAVDSV